MTRTSAPLFDVYIIVDWSAANSPKRGKDSIWIAEARRTRNKAEVIRLENPATRRRAMSVLTDIICSRMASSRKVFAGFDFPFGYPAGAATKITGKPSWRALWAALHDWVEDDEHNRSNRFELAASVNRRNFDNPVFWGRPNRHEYETLPARKAPSAVRDAMEFRAVEKRQRPAKSVWQLYGNGAVGGQVLTGLPRLEALRRAFSGQVRVWPFETHFAEKFDAPLTLAEIYPSMFPVAPAAGEAKDCAQVRTLAQIFAETDAAGDFHQWLSAPSGINAAARRAVLNEEGWIVGAGRVKN